MHVDQETFLYGIKGFLGSYYLALAGMNALRRSTVGIR